MQVSEEMQEKLAEALKEKAKVSCATCLQSKLCRRCSTNHRCRVEGHARSVAQLMHWSLKSARPVVLQQKAEREARLADKKAKKEEDRRKKFAKKVSFVVIRICGS